MRKQNGGKRSLLQLLGHECSACRPREARLRAGEEQASVTRGTHVCPHPHMPEPGDHTQDIECITYIQDSEHITYIQDSECIIHNHNTVCITQKTRNASHACPGQWRNQVTDVRLRFKMFFHLIDECKYANVTALLEEMK